MQTKIFVISKAFETLNATQKTTITARNKIQMIVKNTLRLKLIQRLNPNYIF